MPRLPQHLVRDVLISYLDVHAVSSSGKRTARSVWFMPAWRAREVYADLVRARDVLLSCRLHLYVRQERRSQGVVSDPKRLNEVTTDVRKDNAACKLNTK
jgi:hypothetical protein